MKPFIRKLAWSAALLGAGAVLVLLFIPDPVPVQTARAVRGPLRVTIDEEGETRIHPRYVVAAPVAGRLAAIRLDEGDAVRSGEPVARLSPQPLDPRGRRQAEANLQAARAGQAEARARLEETRSAHEQARRSLVRSESLAAAGQLSAEDLDRARTAASTLEKALEAGRFRAEAARCQVESARAALLESGGSATIDICAPADGRVLRLFEDSERVVPAGAPLIEIGDAAQIEVVVDLLSTDAVAVLPGTAMLLDGGGGRTYRGRVRLVEPAAFTKVSPLGVEEQRVNVIGDLVESAPALGDRYRVEVQIVLWEGTDILKVPGGAVFRSDGGWALFVVRNGRARRRTVKVGHRNSLEVEILEGLSQGEIVIVYPGDRLRDGARIATKGAA